jgi:hypothetical protein
VGPVPDTILMGNLVAPGIELGNSAMNTLKTVVIGEK